MSPEPSRVLVHVHSLALGGTQINALDFAGALRARGYESLVVGPAESLPAGPSLLDVAADRGLRVVPYRTPRRLWEQARALDRLAAEHGADIVHVYSSWGYRQAFWGPCLLARRPLVQTIYEMAVEPNAYRRTPMVVGTGYLVDDLADRPGRTVLISPPVDVDADDSSVVDPAAFIASLGLPEHHRLVVMVTRLDRTMKLPAVAAAIEAVRRLDLDDVALVVVGGGDAAADLAEQAARVNEELGRRAVVLTGPMADPAPAYAAADLVLGMGGSAARALAFGRPLVAQGERGWSEIFRPQTAAAVFRNSFWSLDEVGDPASLLAQHIRTVLQDEALRRELGAFGREFAVARFGREAMADRLAELYAAARPSHRPAAWLADLRCEAVTILSRVSSTARTAAARGRAAVARALDRATTSPTATEPEGGLP